MDDHLTKIKEIGFVRAGSWELEKGVPAVRLDKRCPTQANVLYAFVVDRQLMYIGKSVKTLAKRMSGYERGHASQKTNKRNHDRIHTSLNLRQEVEIYILPDSGLLHYGVFHLNLAAGLEDDLIRKLDPPWNGGKKETENEILQPTLPASSSDSE